MLRKPKNSESNRQIKIRLIKALGITLLAFTLSFILMQPFSFSAASLLSSSDGNDFTINDFYNKVADSRHIATLDSNIVVVDIAESDRNGIAEILETVALCGPRAVGLDVLFADSREGDGRLIEAVRNCPNIVLAASVKKDAGADRFTIDEETYFADSLGEVQVGAINFPTQQTNRTIREFRPDYTAADGSDIPSFALALSEMNAPDSHNTEIFRARDNEHETIRYYSRIFKTFTPDNLIEHAEELCDKIVMIGAMTDPGDIHATPVTNSMPGILIHAHAVATILSGSYFYQLHQYVNWAIAFISCFVVIFLSLSLNIGIKGLLLRVLQVGLLYLSIRVGYYFFIEHNVIINFSHTLLMLTFGLFACDIWIGFTTIFKWIARRFIKPEKSNANNIYIR